MARRPIATTPAPKTSASERTLPLPLNEPRFVECECGLRASVGSWEGWSNVCPSCGAMVGTGDAQDSLTEHEHAAQADALGAPDAEDVQAAADAAPAPTRRRRAAAPAPEPKPEEENDGSHEEEEGPKCETCGADLTQTTLGIFYPCGHDRRTEAQREQMVEQHAPQATVTPIRRVAKPKQEEAPAPNHPSFSATPMATAGNHNVGQEITVVWGEETYTPTQFHSFRVGPFTAIGHVAPGETYGAAMARVMSDLRAFGDAERERKKDGYLKMAASISKR